MVRDIHNRLRRPCVSLRMTGVDFARPSIGVLSPRLVNAEWLFVQIITAGRVGPRAASHTDISKLTIAAFAFQIIRVPQFLKNLGILPNLCKRLFVQVSRQNRQIPTRINLTFMRNEADARAGEAPLGHCVHTIGVAMAGLGWVRMKRDAG